ncbi:uncharacterized protein LOC121764096 [Salvia splendens]|uniref:uncharacterized protein LOC121764096 n=1 Tax=Salvia splendens TaxID=180675 RepID=UPI001C26245D|nr:uncharacterized protein LOC121764096 [Salvia splendens]
MQASANKRRRHVEFEEGDLVWLKLQPYRQHSVARPLSAKLARRYYGPFEILERVGPVAYRLRLLEGSHIHDVFHVSQLREFVAGEGSMSHVPLPSDFIGDRPIVQPVAFVESQVMWHNGKAVEHVLVRWSDGSESPSLEPLEEIRKRFPNLHLEVKDDVKMVGVDTDSHAAEEPAVAKEPRAVTETPSQQQRETEDVAATRTLRSRDRIKPPRKYTA